MHQHPKHILFTPVVAAAVALPAGWAGPKHLLAESPRTMLQAEKLPLEPQGLQGKGPIPE